MPPKLVDATSSALRSTSACTASTSFQLDSDQPPETLHLQRRDLIRGIVGQARVADRAHCRMGLQHHRECLSVVTLPFEPQTRSTEASTHQPRFERAEDRAGELAVLFNRGHQFGMAAGDVSGDQIAVSRQRFGCAGDHEVGT